MHIEIIQRWPDPCKCSVSACHPPTPYAPIHLIEVEWGTHSEYRNCTASVATKRVMSLENRMPYQSLSTGLRDVVWPSSHYHRPGPLSIKYLLTRTDSPQSKVFA